MTAEVYLRSVSYWLHDLPWSMRRELLSELRGHLDELPAGTDFAARLGKPEQYAADLRAAAGLERRRGVVAFLRARRPRNLILTVVTLTVIGLAIGAVAWIDTYQPLSFAGGTYLPAGVKGTVTSNDELVVFHKGRPFRYGMTIQNTGRFTVRVLGVPYGPVLPFSARLLMSVPAPPSELHVFPGPLKPFHPFDLRPGELTSLILKGVYACHSGMGRGPGLTWGAFPVRYRLLWRTATVSIPLDGTLTFDFPRGCKYQKP